MQGTRLQQWTETQCMDGIVSPGAAWAALLHMQIQC
jgi:hypothetical protein